MIYITGDTHGGIDYGKLMSFKAKNPALTKNDYLIITGDFGAIWNAQSVERDLQKYIRLPVTVLFVDGNHENFDLLNSYPIIQWNGGKVHVIKQDIIHLMRGQIFSIEGKTFFTFGGGTSIDKIYRKEGTSWWKEELPSMEEFNEAVKNLNNVGNKVDYIITHSIDERALYYPLLRSVQKSYTVFPDNAMLNYFEENTSYQHWYFGHFHVDGFITENKTAVYQEIIKL